MTCAKKKWGSLLGDDHCSSADLQKEPFLLWLGKKPEDIWKGTRRDIAEAKHDEVMSQICTIWQMSLKLGRVLEDIQKIPGRRDHTKAKEAQQMHFLQVSMRSFWTMFVRCSVPPALEETQRYLDGNCKRPAIGSVTLSRLFFNVFWIKVTQNLQLSDRIRWVTNVWAKCSRSAR